MYKYVKYERIDILRNEVIRFSQPSVLNDPLEMRPHVQELFSDETYQQIFIDPFVADPQKVIEMMIPHILKNPACRLSENQIRDHLKECVKNDPDEFASVTNNALRMSRGNLHEEEGLLLDEFPKSVDAKLGILSLTKNPIHELMWSHYADAHTGFVIEFDEHQPFFTDKQGEHDNFSGLHRVIYSADRPHFKELAELLNAKVGWTPLLFTKSKSWEYEQEWRTVKVLSDANKIIPHSNGDIFLFKLPISCVKNLILGCRMLAENKAEIIHFIKTDARYSHVHLLQASMSDTSYAIELKAI